MLESWAPLVACWAIDLWKPMAVLITVLDGRPVCGDSVGTWAEVIELKANLYFGRHFPDRPGKERPKGLPAGG